MQQYSLGVNPTTYKARIPAEKNPNVHPSSTPPTQNRALSQDPFLPRPLNKTLLQYFKSFHVRGGGRIYKRLLGSRSLSSIPTSTYWVSSSRRGSNYDPKRSVNLKEWISILAIHTDDMLRHKTSRHNLKLGCFTITVKWLQLPLFIP